MGFRAIDTANQRKHYYEAAVGEALAAACRAGVTTRAELFLQTKYTYQRGQDHRLPYDPQVDISTQVTQSLSSSLEHLGTDYVDSFVLHGPSSHIWTATDVTAWKAMQQERDAGRTRLLGLSNVGLQHLEQLAASGAELPFFVQNRCFARYGWDREVRRYCREHNIVYQGFSLLTANVELLGRAEVHAIARKLRATLPQTIFAFCRAIGILPLTGTSSTDHMREDLDSLGISLEEEDVKLIESLAG